MFTVSSQIMWLNSEQLKSRECIMILIVFISCSIKLFHILPEKYRTCLVSSLKCTVSCIAVYMDVFLQVLKVSCIRDLLQFSFIFNKIRSMKLALLSM